ncbi:MAG: VWA domain-containing protein [Bryobacter sp.]|jgi:VWFA-related protein|nr:VWA domain-containing protein [Bryobacter sp. CoA8 C33]
MRLLAFLFCLIALQAGQESAATFHSSVTQVRLDLLATNGQGPLGQLRAEDLVIQDEGQPVRITSFHRETPDLNILLLLDVSGSMKTFLSQIGQNARTLLGQLRQQDRTGVMVFSKETDYLMPFSSRLDRVVNAIDQALRPGLMPAGTAINAALVDAAEAFLTNPKLTGHRAIFILTDNKSLNYRVPDELVLRKLFAADTVLNAIVTSNAESPRPYKNPSERNPDFSWADVFKLSAETGGETLRTGRADEAFTRLLGNLRQRYLITYDAPPAPANQFRRVRLTLTAQARKKFGKLNLKVRSGYYTGS